MYKVTFTFESGETVEAFATSGENLLEVARKRMLRLMLPVPVTQSAVNAA